MAQKSPEGLLESTNLRYVVVFEPWSRRPERSSLVPQVTLLKLKLLLQEHEVGNAAELTLTPIGREVRLVNPAKASVAYSQRGLLIGEPDWQPGH